MLATMKSLFMALPLESGKGTLYPDVIAIIPLPLLQNQGSSARLVIYKPFHFPTGIRPLGALIETRLTTTKLKLSKSTIPVSSKTGAPLQTTKKPRP
jgi:hypothetical protein